MPKRWTEEEEVYLLENINKMSRAEVATHFGVTVKSISDKLRRLNRKTPEKPKTTIAKSFGDPLDCFGPVRKLFIREFIREIDYRDLARLIDVSPEELKKAVEKTGIKLPYEQTEKWVNIDVGKFKSIADCARCQVQCNHSSFMVGFKECRTCLENNIRHWVENGTLIFIKFRGGD